MKNKYQFFGIVALIAVIALVTTGCPNSANGDNEPVNGNGSVSVTVTPASAYVAQGGQWQFAATVQPAGPVTWTLEPAGAGNITADGLLTPTASPGMQLIVRATSVDHPTVYGTATVTVGQPMQPTSVTVSPSIASVAREGRQRFTATVGPEGAPQAVEWSVEPANAGTITEGGWLSVGWNAAVGSTLTVRATATGTTASSTATVTVSEPTTITVTGVTAAGMDGRAIVLFSLDTGNRVASGESPDISDSSMAFTSLWPMGGGQFATSGTYEIRLLLLDWDGGDRHWYHIPSRSLTAGANTIPFSAFTSMPPIGVSVTGIPDQYHGTVGLMELLSPGNIINLDGSLFSRDAEITGSSAEFTMLGVTTGTYDVFLVFRDIYTYEVLTVYRTSSRNIVVATNSIAFGQFTALPPSVTITVTGIQYNGTWGQMWLEAPWPYGSDWSEKIVTSSSATFRFWRFDPGVYDVGLYLNDWRSTYILPSRNVYVGTNVPLSEFTLYSRWEPR